MRKIVLFLATLAFSTSSFELHAQSGFAGASGNAGTQRFQVLTQDGRVLTVDNITKKIYVEKQDGTHAVVTFDETIDSIGLTPAEEIQFSQDVSTALAGSHINFWKTTSATPPPPPPNPREGDPGDVIIKLHSQDKNSFLQQSLPEDPLDHWGPGGPCDLSPCTPYVDWGTGNIYYIQDAHSPGIGTESPQEQSEWAQDAARWENEVKSPACVEAGIAYGEYVANAGMAANACKRPTGRVGVLACGAGLLLTIISEYQFNQAMEGCHASYPGPGNW